VGKLKETQFLLFEIKCVSHSNYPVDKVFMHIISTRGLRKLADGMVDQHTTADYAVC